MFEDWANSLLIPSYWDAYGQNLKGLGSKVIVAIKTRLLLFYSSFKAIKRQKSSRQRLINNWNDSKKHLGVKVFYEIQICKIETFYFNHLSSYLKYQMFFYDIFIVVFKWRIFFGYLFIVEETFFAQHYLFIKYINFVQSMCLFFQPYRILN